jgi:hypothetical protein
MFALYMPLPSPPPSPIATATAVAEEELHELLLAWEEALTTREEKARISEKALAKVSADLDVERAKVEATRKEYLNKMVAHTTRAKQSLGLDKMLREKKVELDGREQDLNLREAVLVEAQTRGLGQLRGADGVHQALEAPSRH